MAPPKCQSVREILLIELKQENATLYHSRQHGLVSLCLSFSFLSNLSFPIFLNLVYSSATASLEVSLTKTPKRIVYIGQVYSRKETTAGPEIEGHFLYSHNGSTVNKVLINYPSLCQSLSLSLSHILLFSRTPVQPASRCSLLAQSRVPAYRHSPGSTQRIPSQSHQVSLPLSSFHLPSSLLVLLLLN